MKKTSDSRASTPSVTGLQQFMSSEDADIYYLTDTCGQAHWSEEACLPPTPQTPGNVTFADPIDNAVAQMNAPQQINETDKAYLRRRSAALHYAQCSTP